MPPRYGALLQLVDNLLGNGFVHVHNVIPFRSFLLKEKFFLSALHRVLRATEKIEDHCWVQQQWGRVHSSAATCQWAGACDAEWAREEVVVCAWAEARARSEHGCCWTGAEPGRPGVERRLVWSETEDLSNDRETYFTARLVSLSCIDATTAALTFAHQLRKMTMEEEMQQEGRGRGSLRRAVTAVEKDIAQNDYETAAVFAKDGTLLLRKRGERVAIRFTPQEALQMIDAAVFTHNHPRNTSFSLADVDLAWRLRIEEIRVVSHSFLYRMKALVGGWRKIEWKTMEETVTTVHANVVQEFEAALDKGLMTEKEADLQGWHTVWLRVARQLSLSYTRRRR